MQDTTKVRKQFNLKQKMSRLQTKDEEADSFPKITPCGENNTTSLENHYIQNSQLHKSSSSKLWLVINIALVKQLAGSCTLVSRQTSKILSMPSESLTSTSINPHNTR